MCTLTGMRCVCTCHDQTTERYRTPSESKRHGPPTGQRPSTPGPLQGMPTAGIVVEQRPFFVYFVRFVYARRVHVYSHLPTRNLDISSDSSSSSSTQTGMGG